MVSREHVLAEIKRVAESNGGKPPGRDRFTELTGIRPGEWAKYWARWADALQEAGFEPNTMQGRFDDESVLELLVSETRRLGHMPTIAEWTLRRYADRSFPSAGVLQRLGSKASGLASSPTTAVTTRTVPTSSRSSSHF